MKNILVRRCVYPYKTCYWVTFEGHLKKKEIRFFLGIKDIFYKNNT